MATQELYVPNRLFHVDLHGVSTGQAARAISARLAECHRFGLDTFRCCFGSPESFRGSILEALREIVLTHRYVRKETLPAWIIDPASVNSTPIFLCVPVLKNSAPEALDGHSRFEAFKAEYELNRGQRLLCEMPYQPLREVYDWDYSARAIKRNCTVQELRRMCSSAGVAHSNEGLTLKALMHAAVAWESYRKAPKEKSRLAGRKAIAEAPALEVTSSPLSAEAAQEAVTELAQDAFPAVTLRLIDGFISSSQYQSALDALDGALAASEPTASLLLRKGKLLLLQDDAVCETWLLRADEAFRRDARGDIEERKECLWLLRNWYVRTNEIDRVLKYQRLLGSLASSEEDISSPGISFYLAFTHAILLRQAGHHLASFTTVKEAILQHALKRGDATPASCCSAVEQLKKSKLPIGLLAKAHLLCSQNAADLADFALAVDMLRLAEALVEGATVAGEVKASLSQQKGILLRKAGDFQGALKCYLRGFALLSSDPYPDLDLEYELSMSAGVACSRLGRFLEAERYYGDCQKLAVKLQKTEHPEHAKLLTSYSALRFRQDRYSDTIDFANRAYELLLLKAPERHFQLGTALDWKGTALNCSGRFDEAILALEEAKREYVRHAGKVPPEILQKLDTEIHAAKSRRAV